MKKLTAFALAASMVFCAASVQAAEINRSLDDRVQVRIGPFFANVDSKIKLSTGEEADLEAALDDRDTTGAFYLGWRVTKRIRLDVGYSRVTRSESKTLDQDIPLGNIATIPAGSALEGEFNTSLLRFTAGYALLRNEKSELGLSLGVAAIGLEDSISFTPAGGSSITLVDGDSTEPLGTIGIYGTYGFAPNWAVLGKVGYLGFDFGDIEGQIWDVYGAVEYRPWKNFGFGAAYVYTNADITQTEKNIDVDFEYSGPIAYLTFGFGSLSK